MSACYCGSTKSFAECCEPLLAGAAATTPEALMRSRYCAYVVKNVPYIMDTTAPETRKTIDEEAVRKWAENTVWNGLSIVKTAVEADGENGMVEFIAKYREDGVYVNHHEIATFTKFAGKWMFVDGTHPKPEQVKLSEPRIGRNDVCSCGSGKKYKKCCGVNG